MQNLPFLYENLPQNLRPQAFDMLEFWAFQGHFSIPKNASFVEIMPFLSEKQRQDMGDYLRFLASKIEPELSPEEKRRQAHALAQRICLHLAKMPAESVETLRQELKKMIPQADSTVMLKVGSGAYAEERETSVGIFIGVQSVKTAENIELEAYFTEVFKLVQTKKLNDLEDVLTDYEQESEPEFWLTWIPFDQIEGNLWGGQFTFHAKLIV